MFAIAPRARLAKPWSPRNGYWWFAIPAVIIVLAVIVFPWLFTLAMSVSSMKIGEAWSFAGMDNYRALATDARFGQSVLRTFYYTVLATVVPVILGTAAAML